MLKSLLALSLILNSSVLCASEDDRPTYFKESKRPELSQECRPIESQLLDQMRQYDDFARRRFDKNTNKNWSNIRTLLTSLYEKRDPCFQPIFVSYALMSLHLTGSDRSYNNEVDPLLRYFIIGSRLASLNKIQPLTPQIRSELGGIWNIKEKKSRYFKVLGSYDCSTGTIFFDPFLPPFDLSGILVHEMDHLFRDKISFSLEKNDEIMRKNLEEKIEKEKTSLKSFPSSYQQDRTESAQGELERLLNERLPVEKIDEIGIRQSILVDEILSVLHGSFRQVELPYLFHTERKRTFLEMLNPFVGMDKMHDGRAIGIDSYTVPGYILKNDITLYNQKGALKAILEAFAKSSYYYTQRETRSTPLSFFGFMSQAFNPNKSDEIETQKDKILQSVSQAYFGEKLAETKTLKDYLSQYQSQLNPLSIRTDYHDASHTERDEKGREIYYHKISKLMGDFEFRNWIDEDTWSSVEASRLGLSRLLDKPSASCQKFLSAVSSGALKGYVGVREGVDGVRPGNGDHTGVDGVRPGEGGHTGVDGVRPGQDGHNGVDGVRPGGALMPCLTPEPEI